MLGFRDSLFNTLTPLLLDPILSCRVMPPREASHRREVSFRTYIQFNTHMLLQKSTAALN